MRAALVTTLLTLMSAATYGAPRSAAELLAFKRANPCPSTGERRGGCPGWVIDHVDPLCNGGEDHRRNMQWQTVADGLEKDKQERRLCRLNRR